LRSACPQEPPKFVLLPISLTTRFGLSPGPRGETLTQPSASLSRAEKVELDAEDTEGLTRLLSSLLINYLAAYVFNKDDPSTAKRRLFEEAAEWFASDDEEPVSFLYVCSYLDRDPGEIRRLLPVMRTEDLAFLRKKHS
jgi:hypothetical protein